MDELGGIGTSNLFLAFQMYHIRIVPILLFLGVA